MSFSITDFKRQMSHDGARPNLFKVKLLAGDDKTYFDSNDNDSFVVRATSIPGATIGTVVVPYLGREVKFAGNRTFADWTVTVLNDEDFSVRAKIEEWMGNINSHNANRRKGKLAGYYGSAEVSQLSKGAESNDGKSLRVYKFNNMFPVDLSEITLDWGDNDSIEEFTCTFAYDYWTVKAGDATHASNKVIL